MVSRSQKPTSRDFLLMHAQTRSHLCSDQETFDPCEKLPQLTAFEKATMMSWSIDSNVDRGLNLYILIHYLSATNNNSYYYHYVNNGNPDGTNMFGHIIGTSGSGKSSALTPHMDALARTLAQLDENQEYIQYSTKDNDLPFDQPFIISNSTALQIYRSLMYGNRLLCSTECDTLLSNLGVYGNQYNDSRFAENVNMLIQMFDGTKHQNRSNLSTSYNIPEGRRASIIGASVGDPYARVSQQHYEGNGISGAHNRFTHYPCPIMKPIKTNSGSRGVISNMVPSLQHIYTVSVLLGKVEYVPRHNVYDKSERIQTNIFNSDVEEKWQRLRSTANREYCHSPLQVEIELEEPEYDATFEHSKSAFYYMFNRVYNQWHEATATEKQEHEAIINFKNSTKIPRFICNFARYRTINTILWDDDVYPFIEISDVAKAPYCVSNNFIEAVKNVIDKLFPPNLRKPDGTKILIIEKDTAIMGDLFFGHIDRVSRQLFDLSLIYKKFNSSPLSSHLTTKGEDTFYDDASFIISSKFIFFSASTFIYDRRFHHKKMQLLKAIEYLVSNELVYQPMEKVRFIKGAHTSYAMRPPNQIKKNNTSIEALTKLKLNIDDYQQIWQQCLLATHELSEKIEKSAIDYIKLHLNDYITIIHRLGNATDPVAREILKPGLLHGEIGINFDSKSFSLEPEHIKHFNNNDDVMEQLSKLCIRTSNEKIGASNNIGLSTLQNYHFTTNTSNTTETYIQNVDDYNQIQAQQLFAPVSVDILSNESYQMDTLQQQIASTKENNNIDCVLSNMDNNNNDDCTFILNKIKTILDNDNINNIDIENNPTSVSDQSYINNKNQKSSMIVENSIRPVVKNKILHEWLTTNQANNNNNNNSFNLDERDSSTTNTLTVDNIDHNLFIERTSPKKLISKLSSSITNEYDSTKENKNNDSNSMDIDMDTSNQASSSKNNTTSENLNKTSNDEDARSKKKFDIIALSKRLMLKPFVAFTQTDVTRLYNDAEAKNRVIKYLLQHQLIQEVKELFLSMSPTKKTFKTEIGYLKLFPTTLSASEADDFETKLREKIGISFDEYFKTVLNIEHSSASTLDINNMFNTAHHNWLLNRNWYNKLNQGNTSEYYRGKIHCPDSNMSSPAVTTHSVSNDDVHDSFDRPRHKLTSSQRTKKELRRLGVKRQGESTDQPPPKRQRKPKRFSDENL